jgi:hypothetical protein
VGTLASHCVINLLVILVALALLLFFLVLQPAARRRERTAHLAALANVLENGHLASGHILGSFASHPVEAWPTKVARSGGSSLTQDPDRLLPGDTFTIRLEGLSGARYWRGGSHPSLNPFGTPDPQLTTQLPASARGIIGGTLIRAVGLPAEPDPELEQRLRAAGLLEQMAQLQAYSTYLHLQFVPSSEGLAEQRMSRLPGFSGFSPELAEQLQTAGHLECLLQAPGGFGPTPQVFAEQLEVLGRIARINAAANPAPEAQHIARPAAVSYQHTADAILGAWSNRMLSITFEPGGTVSVSRGRHHQRGTWSVDAQGRAQVNVDKMHASAWIDGQALTVLFKEGMALTLQRG